MKKIKYIFGIGVSFIIGYFFSEYKQTQVICDARNMSSKHLVLYLLMEQWVRLKQKNKSIVNYLKSLNYYNIAIYGMSYVGKCLYDELEDSEVKVKYGIDNNAMGIKAKCKLVTIQDILEPVDAVIVTSVFYYEDVKEKLSDKVDCPILSIEDILYELE